MRAKRAKMVIPFLCLAFLFAGCGTQPGTNQSAGTKWTRTKPAQPQATPPVQNRNVNDATIIPSYGGEKLQTTNQQGTTHSGMGTNVYSMIGSSGVEGGGISSSLEAMLNRAGIEGVRVLVLDDTVILGQSNNHLSDGSRYDAMQSKLLSGYAGTSSTGPKNSTGFTGTNGTSGSGAKGGTTDGTRGTSGTHATGTTGNTGGNPMEQARNEINRICGGNVRVVTLTHPKGAKAIERVKANLKSASSSYQLSKDLSMIMKMAANKGKK